MSDPAKKPTASGPRRASSEELYWSRMFSVNAGQSKPAAHKGSASKSVQGERRAPAVDRHQ